MVEPEAASHSKFRNHFGPIDLDSLSVRDIDDVFLDVKELLALNGFRAVEGPVHGSLAVSYSKSDVTFILNVMHFQSAQEGCCVVVEEVRPSPTKFEVLFNSLLRDKLRGIIG